MPFLKRKNIFGKKIFPINIFLNYYHNFSNVRLQKWGTLFTYWYVTKICSKAQNRLFPIIILYFWSLNRSSAFKIVLFTHLLKNQCLKGFHKSAKSVTSCYYRFAHNKGRKSFNFRLNRKSLSKQKSDVITSFVSVGQPN